MLAGAARVVLDHVALTASGPTVALSLYSGQSLALVGRAGAGKSRLLRAILGETAPERGEIEVSGEALAAMRLGPSRRLRPQGLAAEAGRARGLIQDRSGHERSGRERSGHDRVTEALVATGLWDDRRTALAELTDGQRVAAALLPALASSAPIVAFDGLLDELDPWTLDRVLGLLRQRQGEGSSWIVATNRPDIAAATDLVVALRDSEVRFAGTPRELIRAVLPSRLEVATDNMPGVRAIARPFEVQVEQAEGVLRFEAAEGQTLAARLLVEGYGDVRFMVLREPTFAEALLALA